MTEEQRKHIDDLVAEFSNVAIPTYNGVSLVEYTPHELRTIITAINIKAIGRRQGQKAMQQAMVRR